MAGLGAVYGVTNEQGNFESENIVRYSSGNLPKQKLIKLFQNEHKRSIYFRNDYISLNIDKIIEHPELILRQAVDSIVEMSSQQSRSGELSFRDLNDSLDYRPKKTIDEGARIRRLKAELDNSVGKSGSEIRPKPSSKSASPAEGMKQLYLSPLEGEKVIEP